MSATSPEVVERLKFYRRCQFPGEILTDYMKELRKIAESCNFGNYLDQVLRDRYVCGIQNDHIRTRLLHERRNLSLENAVKISQYLENSWQLTESDFTRRNRENENHIQIDGSNVRNISTGNALNVLQEQSSVNSTANVLEWESCLNRTRKKISDEKDLMMENSIEVSKQVENMLKPVLDHCQTDIKNDNVSLHTYSGVCMDQADILIDEELISDEISQTDSMTNDESFVETSQTWEHPNTENDLSTIDETFESDLITTDETFEAAESFNTDEETNSMDEDTTFGELLEQPRYLDATERKYFMKQDVNLGKIIDTSHYLDTTEDGDPIEEELIALRKTNNDTAERFVSMEMNEKENSKIGDTNFDEDMLDLNQMENSLENIRAFEMTLISLQSFDYKQLERWIEKYIVQKALEISQCRLQSPHITRVESSHYLTKTDIENSYEKDDTSRGDSDKLHDLKSFQIENRKEENFLENVLEESRDSPYEVSASESSVYETLRVPQCAELDKVVTRDVSHIFDILERLKISETQGENCTKSRKELRREGSQCGDRTEMKDINVRNCTSEASIVPQDITSTTYPEDSFKRCLELGNVMKVPFDNTMKSMKRLDEKKSGENVLFVDRTLVENLIVKDVNELKHSQGGNVAQHYQTQGMTRNNEDNIEKYHQLPKYHNKAHEQNSITNLYTSSEISLHKEICSAKARAKDLIMQKVSKSEMILDEQICAAKAHMEDLSRKVKNLEKVLEEKPIFQCIENSIMKKLMSEEHFSVSQSPHENQTKERTDTNVYSDDSLQITDLIKRSSKENSMITEDKPISTSTLIALKDRRCHCCNSSGHYADECKHKYATCYKCGTTGHIPIACL